MKHPAKRLRASLGRKPLSRGRLSSWRSCAKPRKIKPPADLWCVFWYAIVLEPGEVPKPNEDLAGPLEFFDIGQLRTSELFPSALAWCSCSRRWRIILSRCLRPTLPPHTLVLFPPSTSPPVDIRGGTYEVVLGRKRTPSAGGSRAASSIAKRTGHFEKPRRVNWAKRFLAVSQPRNLKSSVPESRWMTPAIAETRTRYSQPCSCSNTSGQTIGGRAVGMICQRSSGLLLSPRWGSPASRAAPSSWRKIWFGSTSRCSKH